MNPEASAGNRFVDRLARDTRLDAAADAVQPAVDAVFAGDDPARKLAKNVLHGTWLGHPLHPLLSDIPIGAWTVGTIADVLALGGDERMAHAGDVATVVGTLGAVGAAWAGWADWSDTVGDPRRLGIAHALVNAGALTLYTTSIALRRSHRRGAATVASLLGYALVAGGGYLGGELAFGLQLGVRHTAEPINPPRDFTRVLAAADVPLDGFVRVTANGIPLLLSRVAGDFGVVSAICTHRGAPLAEGAREGDCVRCPWHGSLFSLADGTVVEGPASFPQPTFELRVRNGDVEVRAMS